MNEMSDQHARPINWLWVDLEMTGLDPIENKIIEFAAVVTDADFNHLTRYHAVVHQPHHELVKMDEWNQSTHRKSGLYDKIPNGKPLCEVDTEITALIQTYFKGERPVLCGNSIHQDRKFIDRYMPELREALHYRMVDVSSFKEVFRQLYGTDFKKADLHRAEDDIQASINELKYYLSFVKR
ncbi:oligoribonuclease [Acanthopleuribacter pedis]|uniref:Oligoribonuclease n=2 Tax=Acanthopleuribacter pedis TaxID=442870 RepID=A0A8J7Q576_9BACT|nr:oligoribonuclease [Acanthopleuribacter pedis]MBO1320632.1 oligoribonuclease [Acanthopleuribacter pedis]